jgi:hypothetical protein
MKIKIFTGSLPKVERQVNEFTASESIKVLDIKFSETFISFSVMVIYEDIDEDNDE